MPDAWDKITSIVPEDVGHLFEDAAARILTTPRLAVDDGKRAVQNGLILEALVADYLAGPDPREQ